MILAALVSLIAAFGGVSLTYLYDARATLGARVAAGYVIGTTLLGFAGYVTASLLGMTSAALLLATGIVLLPGLIFRRSGPRAQAVTDIRSAIRIPRRFRPRRIAYLAVFAAFAAFFLYLYLGTMYIRDGAIWTDNHNNFGDLPFHLAIIQGFVVGKNFPPQHPEYSGIRLTYPFMVDFEAAQLVTAGATLSGAILLQNMLLALSLLTLLLRWAVFVTRRVGAALLAPALFVFSGGLGFVVAWQDWRQSGLSLTAFLAALPRDYTTDGERGLRWANTMTALLTTQRGLLIAIPLALIVWTLWWQILQSRRTDPVPYRRLIACGMITGMLPLVHGHTFLMLLMVGGTLALGDIWRNPARFKPWAACFAIALILAVPQAILLASSSGSQGGKFIGWQPGWDSAGEMLLLFWWRNLGVLIPLLMLSLIWRPGHAGSVVPPRLLRYYVPFTLCFIVPNLLRLAPWVWDNIKVLLYWHLASLVLVAALLAHLWRRNKSRSLFEAGARRVLVMCLITAMTLSGGLDILRISRGEVRSSGLYSSDAIAFSKAVIELTQPGDIFLCAPQYNSPILLTGRREMMGYEGHLWSHGLNYGQRRADVQKMFAGSPDTPALLEKYHVRYVAVGPLDRDMTDYPLNEAYWQTYPVALRSGPYTLYRVDSAR